MQRLITHTRKYGDLKVEVRRPDNDRPEGPIEDVILTMPGCELGCCQDDAVQISAEQAWNLVDLLSIVDPDEFQRRFPDTRDETLDQVANIARMREEVCDKLAKRLASPQRKAADLYTAKADAFREIEAIILNHKEES